MQKKHEIIYKIVAETVAKDELESFNKLYYKFFTFLDTNRNDIDINKLSQWQNFLNELDILNNNGNILSLKVVTAILYQEERSYYYREEIIDALLERFKHYFSSETIDRREKIEFAVVYKIKQPKNSLWQYSDYRFTNSLEELFIEEAKENPIYILEQFEKIDSADRNYFFYFLDETPKNFLEFARLLQEYRPLLYLKALVNFVYYANESRDENIDKSEFCSVSKELYEKIVQEDYPTKFRLEDALEKLIQCSYMDADWYEELFPLLWKVESKKEQRDDKSLLNYLQTDVTIKQKNKLEKIATN